MTMDRSRCVAAVSGPQGLKISGDVDAIDWPDLSTRYLGFGCCSGRPVLSLVTFQTRLGSDTGMTAKKPSG